jgi:hypothetical protein
MEAIALRYIPDGLDAKKRALTDLKCLAVYTADRGTTLRDVAKEQLGGSTDTSAHVRVKRGARFYKPFYLDGYSLPETMDLVQKSITDTPSRKRLRNTAKKKVRKVSAPILIAPTDPAPTKSILEKLLGHAGGALFACCIVIAVYAWLAYTLLGILAATLYRLPGILTATLCRKAKAVCKAAIKG